MSEPDTSRPVRLGEIAVELNFISPEDLEGVLQVKREGTSFVGIGETMVFKKLITRDQLDALLTEQARRLGAESDRLFGQIAIDLGLVSSKSVDNALAEQRTRGMGGLRTPIGMILAERDLLSTSDVEHILHVQVERAQKDP
ncbi:MAG: hypothetical protein ACYS47_03995 [Planctomycetota bacterium]|jgi:hypothetical protein